MTRPPRGPLPDIDRVQVKSVTDLSRRGARIRGVGYHGTTAPWTPRDDQDRDEDRELGRRGEELVLRHLQTRLRHDGRSPDLAVWVANGDRFADHDITSIDPDGTTVWIEVKATTGRDGRFRWPRAEFQLALRARDGYVLYRVYEAQTTSSTILKIDPISRFQSGDIDLNLDSLAGDVGAVT